MLPNHKSDELNIFNLIAEQYNLILLLFALIIESSGTVLELVDCLKWYNFFAGRYNSY
jgi:hypothetical protein